MLLENFKRIFKKPDEEKEALKKQELESIPLEKGDIIVYNIRVVI